MITIFSNYLQIWILHCNFFFWPEIYFCFVLETVGEGGWKQWPNLVKHFFHFMGFIFTIVMCNTFVWYIKGVLFWTKYHFVFLNKNILLMYISNINFRKINPRSISRACYVDEYWSFLTQKINCVLNSQTQFRPIFVKIMQKRKWI